MSIDEIIAELNKMAQHHELCGQAFASDFRREKYQKWGQTVRETIALLRTHQDNQQGELQGNGWRSVDDPPKDGEEVLVYTAWHETMATLKVVYLNGAWWRKPGMQRLPSVPTHWRPLPEPPKEG